LRQRIFQIARGYEDANDCDSLRRDPACKAACERLPIVGEDLASQPTMSRLDNAPRRSELYRMAQALLETFVASYDRPPRPCFWILMIRQMRCMGPNNRRCSMGTMMRIATCPCISMKVKAGS
jgi:hypothetical protein